eukprot:TRINITY_DN10537_c0_g1_i2.p1 TRINITY_DN10537_c0_g1~~TRINITY_DN10537_c0_g1_i2.p1  ORF type:complete len:250 (-),score=46.59 TRINITY_DN10537_c0_g1_i2:35-784(-)
MSARPPPRNTCPWADDNEALDMHTKDLEAAARKREVIGKQADSLQGDGASEDVDLHTRDLEMAARKRAVLQQQGAALQKARLSLPRETAPLAYSSPRGGQDMVQVGLIMRCIEEGLSGEEMRKMLQQCSNGLLLDPGAATSPPAAFSLAAKRHADMLATPRIKPGAIDSASSRKAYLDAQSQVLRRGRAKLAEDGIIARAETAGHSSKRDAVAAGEGRACLRLGSVAQCLRERSYSCKRHAGEEHHWAK